MSESDTNPNTNTHDQSSQSSQSQPFTIKNIALSGGGSKSYAYVGAFRALEELGCLDTVERIVGSSAGAVFGFLLILKLTKEEFYEFIEDFEYTKIKDVKFKDVLTNWGFDTGNKVVQFFRLLMKKKTGKTEMTFAELYDFNPVHFTVSATHLNTHRTVYYNKDDSPNDSVIQSLRKSAAFPGLMTPVREGDDCYIDGGASDNFPIQLLPDSDQTLGLILKTDLHTYHPIKHAEDYLWHLLKVMMKDESYGRVDYIKNSHIIRIVTGQESSHFQVNETFRKDLDQKGYHAIYDHFTEKYHITNIRKPITNKTKTK